MSMQNGFVRVIAQILGAILVVIGILGLFLPFLQGILILVVGLYILCISSPAFKGHLDRFLTRWPKAKAHFDRQYERVNSFFKRKKAEFTEEPHDHR